MNKLELCIWDLKPITVGKIHMWKDNIHDWKTEMGKHALFRSHRSKG